LANGIPSAKFLLPQTSSYTSDVNQSLKKRTRFTSYMRASFVDLHSGVGVLEWSRYSASIESVVVYIKSMWI